jgi:hypothetical protein
VVLLCALAAPAGAATDTLTLSATPTTVPGGATVTISAGGSVATPDTRLELLAEPAADTCTATFDAAFESLSSPAMPVMTNIETALEQGTLNRSIPLSIELAPQYNPGSGSPSSTLIASPGEYRVCGYLETITSHNESELLTSATTTFAVRAPEDTIALAPSLSSASERYTVPIGYTIEPGTTPVVVVVGFYPTFPIEGQGFNCAYPEVAKSYEPAPGTGTLSFSIEHGSAGVYGLCVRVFNKPLPTVELARASMTITVTAGAHQETTATPGSHGTTVIRGSHQGAGSSACVVPRLAGKRLRRARKALSRAHCRLGRVTRRHRAGHRQGTVVIQGAKPGKRLPRGSRISVVLAH